MVIDFKVIDESEDWIVVDKPAPLIVHPANRKPEPTLLGGIEQLLAYEIENGAFPAIVNRLDRDTSGVVIAAKTKKAARELGMIFERREAEKEYLAIVHGWPESTEWECRESIVRAGDLGPSHIWVRQVVSNEGRQSATRFSVLRRFEREEGKFALIQCFPETGRMHQIRVHLAHHGHPVVGDKLYSGDGSEYIEWMADGWTLDLQRRLLLSRHALHASRLALPWKGRLAHWISPLASELVDFCEGKPCRETADVVIWSRHD